MALTPDGPRETSLAAKPIESHRAVKQTAMELPNSSPNGAVIAAAQYAAWQSLRAATAYRAEACSLVARRAGSRGLPLVIGLPVRRRSSSAEAAVERRRQDA